MPLQRSVAPLLRAVSAASLLVLLVCVCARAQNWTALGPAGGDVHSMAVDPAHPNRLFLGTADGHIFGSEDSGEHWSLLGRAGSRHDGVITAILVDPRDANVLFASAWYRDADSGGVFRSDDGGRTWRAAGMEGQAVRALAMAPSDPDELVAGTLDGVYRSRDGAKSWERISPEHHAELRNLDSLAIDPRDPDIIYAGTFHLPWKTADGGRRWNPIHKGMIDDSDVMSFLVDRQNPARIYSSACSGIYRSENGAEQWEKIQGIPYTARRTYQITQDPRHPMVVYAATSEGLWKTSDGGLTWRRTTPQDWAVNTVVVPDGEAGRVIIGTDKLGALASDDNGEHFHDANSGFFHRQVLTMAFDAANPLAIVAVLAHAPAAVVASGDGGKTWTPFGSGLRPESVLRVYSAPGHTSAAWWASLVTGGLMRYDAQTKSWQPADVLTGEAAVGAPPGPAKTLRLPGTRTRAVRGTPERANAGGRAPFHTLVYDMAFSENRWFAATEAGLLVSSDGGDTWNLEHLGAASTVPTQSVRVSPDGQHLWVASLRGMAFSVDAGNSWTWHDLPLAAGVATTLDIDSADENVLVASARNGLYLSRDAGNTWQQPGAGLPAAPVQDVAIAANVFLASMRTGGLYLSTDSGKSWNRMQGSLADGFFPAVRVITGSSDHGANPAIYAVSATDGVYLVDLPLPN
jgi:photosystem II stability/assembly factor-like uncharacterized protein